MEKKRYGSTNGSIEDGSVHNRLYQAAVAKQRAHRTIDDGEDADSQRPFGCKGRSNSLRHSTSNMPQGQYVMMMDQKRSSLRQNHMTNSA